MRILLVDDEQLARDELRYLLLHNDVFPDVEIFEAEDISTALKCLLEQEIDLLFLDISLDGENGFDIARRIEGLKHPPFIIFATAFADFAVDAFATMAVDYLLKPFEQQRVNQTLQKIQHLLQQKPTVGQKTELLSLDTEDRTVILRLDELLAASINQGQLDLWTHNKHYQVKRSLSWLMKSLDESFLQIHRNSVVNLTKVREVQPWFNHTYLVVINDELKFPVGRSYIKSLKQHLHMS